MNAQLSNSVNRADRDGLIQLVQRYLAEEITAFEFDEQLAEIGGRTTDATVKWSVDFLWGFYDDCEDHKVVATKQEWDAIQRLLLLLHSNGMVKSSPRREWTPRQFVASLGLLAFLCVVWRTGFDNHLILASLPLGIVSMLLHRWQENCDISASTEKQGRLVPFASVSEMLGFRRRAHAFWKAKYPTRLKGRLIRSRSAEAVLRFQAHVMWLIFSPIVLLIQSLPESHSEWSVTTTQT